MAFKKNQCYLCGRLENQYKLITHHFSYPFDTERICNRCHIIWHLKLKLPLKNGRKFIRLFRKYIFGKKKIKKAIIKLIKQKSLKEKEKIILRKNKLL